MPGGSRRPTLRDVARLAGTSTAVVSYVVNDGPRAVAPATRERVEAAIRELGYRRNPLAGALSAGHSNLVGLLVPDTANGFFGELSRHIEGEGRARGLLTLLGNTGYDADVSEDYRLAFSDLRPWGILTTHILEGVETREDVPGDVPRAYVHSAPPGSAVPSVTFNDFGGAVAMVSHLLGHGFEDIHCLSGVFVGGPAGRREEGWRWAMTDAGVATEGRLHRVSFDRVEAEAQIREVLGGGQRPRAVFATTDEQALAALRAAAVLGLSVPGDLAVVGFDGIREALLGSVRLTTVSLPLDELAVRAFETLSAVSATGSAESVVLEGSLVIGETCGCG